MRKHLAAVLLLLAPLVPQAEPLDQNGKRHNWKGQVGRTTVIDFAAAWCMPCWKVLPRLQRFADEHPDIAVIVVSVDDKQRGRDKLVEKLGLTIPVLWDENHEIAEHYRPGAMPATFVLNPKGEVVYSHTGSGEREWKAMIAFLDAIAPQ